MSPEEVTGVCAWPAPPAGLRARRAEPRKFMQPHWIARYARIGSRLQKARGAGKVLTRLLSFGDGEDRTGWRRISSRTGSETLGHQYWRGLAESGILEPTRDAGRTP